MVEVLLARYDYDVATAKSMASGLLLAQTEPFNLYVLDTNLSDGSGTELCERIRKFDPLTPIIFFSGEAPGQRLTELECDVQAYVLKPELGHLLQSISRVMSAVSI